MMIKIFLTALIAVMTVCEANAQKLFTLEELNFGGKNAYSFVPQRFAYRWWGNKLIDKIAENILSALKNPEEAIFKTPAET